MGTVKSSKIVKAGEVEKVNAGELAAQEASARQGLAARTKASAPAPTPDAGELSAFDSALSRLGFKGAHELPNHPMASDETAVIDINGKSLGKLQVVGKNDATGNAGVNVTVGSIVAGVNLAQLERLYVTVDRALVLQLAAQNVKTRANASKRMNGLQSGLWYKPTPEFAQGATNQFVYAEVVDGVGYIDLMVNDSPVRVSVGSADVLALTGKKASNGKPRDYVYADVVYAGDKPATERIVSAWLPGLITAIMSRKVAIIGNDENAIAPVLPDDAYAGEIESEPAETESE